MIGMRTSAVCAWWPTCDQLEYLLACPNPYNIIINILINKSFYKGGRKYQLRVRWEGDWLCREEIEELRLKLFILLILVNYLLIYLYFSRIFRYSSRFFIFISSFRFRIFFDVQHCILGPVHSMFVMILRFS